MTSDHIKAEAERVHGIFHRIIFHKIVGYKARNKVSARCAIVCLEEKIGLCDDQAMDSDDFQKQIEYLTDTYLKEKP